ncbi:MAG: hypothetical protein K2K35_07880 [Lachnospiraceae bacterium]|nr:hypothetical protein [Lachnospiraceae bacterium]
MKNFKEMLDRDLDRTFYNTGEFAELHKIKLYGVEREIPVIFDTDSEDRRKITADDNAEGIHLDTIVMRVKLSSLAQPPGQGAVLWIDGERYSVLSCQKAYNELLVTLEGYDE